MPSKSIARADRRDATVQVLRWNPLVSGLFIMLAMTSCVSSGDYQREKGKARDLQHEAALRSERIVTVSAQRDAARRDTERELAMRRELEAKKTRCRTS